MEAATAIRLLPARRHAAAFERECERLRPLGEAYVLHRFRGSLSRADAEDAVAEVLIRLHRRVAEGRPPQNLRAVFFTSVRNAAIGQLRSRAVRPTVALDSAAEAAAESPTPAERAEHREDAVRLQEALARMRDSYREAILLRFGFGLTVPEIAEHLGISLPAAKKRLLRATQQVRKRLAAIEAEQFCPEMRSLARRSLFEKGASGLASEAETRILRAHFEHCGSCRSFLATLHENLYELGSTALLGLTAANPLGHLTVLDRLSQWLAHGAATSVERVRHLVLRITAPLQSGDGAAGALLGSGQKIAAICTAGAATTATCLATGIVEPGIGAGSLHPPPAHARQAPAPAVTLPSAVPSGAQASASAASTALGPRAASGRRSSGASSRSSEAHRTAAKTAAEQSKAEFGFESTSSSPSPPPTASSSSTSTSSPQPTSSGGGSGSGGGSRSGTESFGFHG